MIQHIPTGLRTASGPAPFDPALRSDVVENRTLHLAVRDPRSSVSCATVTLRARFTPWQRSRRRQSHLSNGAGPDSAGRARGHWRLPVTTSGGWGPGGERRRALEAARSPAR